MYVEGRWEAFDHRLIEGIQDAVIGVSDVGATSFGSEAMRLRE